MSKVSAVYSPVLPQSDGIFFLFLGGLHMRNGDGEDIAWDRRASTLHNVLFVQYVYHLTYTYIRPVRPVCPVRPVRPVPIVRKIIGSGLM